MKIVYSVCAFALLIAAAESQSPPVRGEVAYAALPTAEQSPAPECATPCYTVQDYYPYRSCKAECNPDICSRNYGVWSSNELCCSPGVAFPEGCSQRPSECWVVESFNLKTCIRDDRKCLQGYSVFGSEAACCAKGAAFPEGCATALAVSAEPCFVPDTYYPSRTCRATRVACDKRGQTWPNLAACCAKGSGAFGEGCSTYVPKAPCWVIDSYDPVRRCRLEGDVARCNRGWGVFQSEEVCCAPGAAFSEGCSQQPASGAANASAPAPVAAQAGR